MFLYLTVSFTFHVFYGYIALFIATIAEGEVSIITAAFAARRGYMDIFMVYFISVAATLASDWFWFFIGRRFGSRYLSGKPALSNKSGKVNDLLHRYPILFLAGYRFLYGFRIVFPLVIGISKIKLKKFIFYSFIGTAVWAGIFTSAGYLFGEILEASFKRLGDYEIETMLTMLATGLIITFIINYRKKKKYEKGRIL